MTILRVQKKENNFLVLDKTCLKQSSLSWGAKGLHSYLMSLPSEWCVNVHDLKNRATNGRDSVRGLLNELAQAGYIVKEQHRDAVTGKYNALEYIIHELPQTMHSIVPNPDIPETDFQGTDLPETDFPGPEKPTVINNNNIKYTENKIIKAAASDAKQAAAFSNQKKQSHTPPSALGFINPAAPEDAVIGAALTPYQRERLESLVQTVGQQGFCVSAGDVEYCLLNPRHFKGSGQDFGRKLNAMRTVICRGEWQTPAEMILAAQKKLDGPLVMLQARFNEAQAEVNHFQRLFDLANVSVRENIEVVLTGARKKMQELELKLMAASV